MAPDGRRIRCDEYIYMAFPVIGRKGVPVSFVFEGLPDKG